MNTVWITGATGAIGSALATRLVNRGTNVVLTARDEHRLNALAEGLGAGACVAPGDMTDRKQANRAMQTGLERFGEIHGLAHCVGAILIRSLLATRESDLRDVFSQNFFSAWIVLQEFVASASQRQGSTSAVLIGSVASVAGFPNHEAVASAKAAVAALAMTSAATYAPKGVRINCVHPGLTRSNMSARLTANGEIAQSLARANPLGRLGEGDDTAALIEFLLSDASSWITGQTISVDGGQAALQRNARG